MLRPLIVSAVALTGLLWVSTGTNGRAEEGKDKPAAATPLQIAQWIKDLDSEEFSSRQQATRRLIAAGKQAAAQVAQAANGQNAEVTARCLEVLSKLLQSADADAKVAAKTELEALAKGKNSAVARQAETLLNPQRPAADDPFAPVPGGIPGLPGVPRIEIRGVGVGGGMRVSTKSVDGNKTIEAEEGGKKTKIEEAAKGGIKMEITETVDGKEKTSKVEAKDVDDLKKNQPEAHKLYEKYSKMGGVRVGVMIGGVAPVLPAMPLRIGPIPQKALDQLEEAKKQLADATDKLRKLAGESRISPEEIKKLADQIEAANKQLEEARAQLPK